MPQFSLIITCYRQEAFIRAAVESALAIPFPNKEILVIDDASTDGSWDILSGYAGRVRLLRNPQNMGATVSRNRCAEAATGRYLVFLDGDDVFLPWCLDLYAHLIEMKDPDMLLTRMQFFSGAVPTPQFDDFGASVEVVEYPELVEKDRSYRGSASAVVVERAMYLSVGGYSDGLFPVECDDLLFKLSHRARAVQVLSHPTVAYRLHSNNTVNCVKRFLDGFHKIAWIEKNGGYGEGWRGHLQRQSFIGGPLAFWIFRGLKVREYRRSLRLLQDGWRLVLAAVAMRLLGRLHRVPSESVSLVAVMAPLRPNVATSAVDRPAWFVPEVARQTQGAGS